MEKICQRESQVSEAMRIVANLRESISGLRALLASEARDENALQRFLTAHPLLFGLQYRRVIPKYRLGGTYELDYALEAPSGLMECRSVAS